MATWSRRRWVRRHCTREKIKWASTHLKCGTARWASDSRECQGQWTVTATSTSTIIITITIRWRANLTLQQLLLWVRGCRQLTAKLAIAPLNQPLPNLPIPRLQLPSHITHRHHLPRALWSIEPCGNFFPKGLTNAPKVTFRWNRHKLTTDRSWR